MSAFWYIVQHGVIWDKDMRVVDPFMADKLAQANGFAYAEQVTNKYDCQMILVDRENKIICSKGID